ncbi:DNA repair protein rhp57 [Diatrype stigma]|uniref:DNA repair protein rhp57 n=1 Tax=Diatrype stigma TaxID=117547 RepID=A0AAN9YSK5_9PEZI
MTDLSRILPDFPIGQYARLLPAIERQQLTTADLLTLEVTDIGKRTQLPLLDVKRFCGAVLEALHVDLGVSDKHQQQQQLKQRQPQQSNDVSEGDAEVAAGNQNSKSRENDENKSARPPPPPPPPSQLRHTLPELAAQWRTISTLDASLDRALGGGIPTGRVTEITGESGAGKTQLLLTLLLAVQLPPERGGLGCPALYVSTEAPLSTVRLAQILRNHPRLRDLGPDAEVGDGEGEGEGGKKKKEGMIRKPSLDHIISTVVPDLESQDHILSFQVPVEVARRGVGLLVLDSVAANYRAEFERTGSGSGGGGKGGLAARSNELVRLGRLLHDLARQHDLAVVVSNQVADRFPSAPVPSSAIATPAAPPKSSLPPPTATTTTMQQRLRHRNTAGLDQSQESPLASRSRGRPPAAAASAMGNAEPTSSIPSSLPSMTGALDVPDIPDLPEEEEEEAMMAAAVAVRSSMPEPAPEGFHDRHHHPSSSTAAPPPALLLDHQQRWFTGWGDEPYPYQGGAGGSSDGSLKTPSLGLVWSAQVAARIALLKRPAYHYPKEVVVAAGGGASSAEYDEYDDIGAGAGAGATTPTLRSWRRWMKVVFAPHVPPSASFASSSSSSGGRDGNGSGGSGGEIGPVEFEITMGGIRAVERKGKRKR